MREITRRRLLRLSAAGLIVSGAGPVFAEAHKPQGADGASSTIVHRNIGSFHAVRWQDHFRTLRHGAIVCDTGSRAVHFWAEDGNTHLVYPCSVPMSEEFARRGRTEVTLKRREPTWIPTPSMRLRNPALPAAIPPGPDNPLGSRALNLSWQYYRIHGIDDSRKIGRKASNGCFGLYNHDVEQLFDMVRVGTQVMVI